MVVQSHEVILSEAKSLHEIDDDGRGVLAHGPVQQLNTVCSVDWQ